MDKVDINIQLIDIYTEIAQLGLEYTDGNADGVFAELSFIDNELKCGLLFASNMGIYDMSSVKTALPECDSSEENRDKYFNAVMDKAEAAAELLTDRPEGLPDVVRIYLDVIKNELSINVIDQADKELYAQGNEAVMGQWIEEIKSFLEKGDNYMEFKEKLVPLGSVVLLEGGTQKLLIIARGINVIQDGKEVVFDYGGVLYPDGLTGDQMAYFNRESISKVYFLGYNDEDNRIMANSIDRYLAETPGVIRGDVHNQNIGV